MKLSRRLVFTLPVAIGSLLGVKGYAMDRTAISSIVADAKTAAEWISSALLSSRYQANFTLESFAEIDRFFDEHAPNGKVVPNGLLSEQFGARIFAIGAYVGETLIRCIGGEWVGDDSDSEAEINISVKLKDDSIVWPVQRAMKRFKNGAEDSIYSYGVALKESNS